MAPDYTPLIDQIDMSSTAASLLLVAGALVGVYILWFGVRMILRAFGGNPWAGYSLRDDIDDRALTLNAARPFEEVGNGSAWSQDRSQAAREVTRNQKWF